MMMIFALTVATVLTACGIETTYSPSSSSRPVALQQYLPLAVLKLLKNSLPVQINPLMLQQYLPLAVCDEGCEAAEERSDDEVRTSLVPDRREGKTKRMG